jgi:phage/plasmid-like protein (TIGR03299 family)
MAHNLNSNNGKVSFVKVGEKAWHGLGTYVNEAMTAAQAIEMGGLNYEVVKQPMYVQNPLRKVPDYFATVRKDTNDILGVVSHKYEVLQNIEAFDFFDSIVDRGEAMYHTAGVLGKGERIFITAKLPADIKVNGETVEQWLLLTTGHDGKSATQVGFSAIAVVCENTLRAALRGLQNSVTILHFKNNRDKLKQAARVMGIASTYGELLSASFNEMSRVKITDAQLRQYIQSVMEPKKETIDSEELKNYSKKFIATVDSIMDFAKTHPTQLIDGRTNTVWGAYNAISGYFGYVKQYGSQEDKMKDLYFKNAGQKIELAYNIAAAML